MTAFEDPKHPAAEPILRPPPDIIARKLGESAVLIRMRTSRIYELNATGARIWELLTRESSRAAVVDQIVDEFAISADDASAAVDDLLATLRSEGLL